VPTSIIFEVMTFYYCEQGIIHVLCKPTMCSNCVIHNSCKILANCLILLYEQHAPTYVVFQSATFVLILTVPHNYLSVRRINKL
jgi:hypothetical protein